MRLLTLALLAPAVCLAACPYARQAETPSGDSPYTKRIDIRDTDSAPIIRAQTLHPPEDPNQKGIMLMNRINPSSMQLYIANADGTNERLLLGNESVFEYHATFSPDGKSIAFTSERNGDGNSDVYMVDIDGSNPRKIAATSAVEDAVSISPDGRYAAYASTRDVFTSNIWVTSLETGATHNLTNQTGVTGSPDSPSGFFSPSWSPDGKWIVFSSDINTGWTGHDNGIGWEHTQNLSIYAITPQGTGFRQVYSEPALSFGSPKFSPDGERIVFYSMTLQQTWNARSSYNVNTTTNQIVSVDFATGLNRITHTNSSGCKVYPQYTTNNTIGYLIKGGSNEGIHYTNGKKILGSMRSPSWSPDGKHVVYEKTGWTTRPLQKKLWTWDSEWEYRFMDVFPDLSAQGMLAFTSKQTGTPGNASVATMQPSEQHFDIPFGTFEHGLTDPVPASSVSSGSAGCFQPSWSPDGSWITFGYGYWFQGRYSKPGSIYRTKADGSYYEALTTNTSNSGSNAGYPSYSHDGKKIVYRVFLPEYGLRVLDLETNKTTTLTTERDNLPFFSPDGEWVLFTRNVTLPERGQFSNYEVCIIRPDGTNFTRLTSSPANDAHAVWTADGRILWSTGMFGFQAEAATYDNTFQPYGQIMVMNVDGSNKTLLTNSLWEDSMPRYVPNAFLKKGGV